MVGVDGGDASKCRCCCVKPLAVVVSEAERNFVGKFVEMFASSELLKEKFSVDTFPSTKVKV
ncbi:hypothetical protein NECAME_06511 [Necator americanus]|uniref:Uncharacterized protein n=1 Tax=Necator americanus TaxID=51031 RepID=W2TVY0_NECAM|nr:hypothetical protein NECAME_06511 [Necator americanus]ETN85216.1 hypothetical protein NECAME_06511 [Necator americanus]